MERGINSSARGAAGDERDKWRQRQLDASPSAWCVERKCRKEGRKEWEECHGRRGG